MHMRRYLIFGFFLLMILAVFLWRRRFYADYSTIPVVDSFVGKGPAEPIQPLPREVHLDARKVALGQSLFDDPRLSRDGTVSCSTCHSLATGGCDRRPASVGISGQVGSINAPTVFNSSANFKQFWDGRAETLEDQIDGPVQASHEMGSSWPDVIAKLSNSSAYAASFAEIYRDGIQPKNVKDAIATFERSLITPDSRFDQYLRGDKDALTADEKHGYEIFKSYGCISCHQGLNIGGNMFQTFGVMADYFADRGHITKADFGRYNVTGDENDRYVFKVPSLRNVDLTAPYFHDGSAPTLEAAVFVMGRYQLGRRLSPAEIADLVKFLKTLTGNYKGAAQ
jgi:cytochrome c peroxidase